MKTHIVSTIIAAGLSISLHAQAPQSPPAINTTNTHAPYLSLKLEMEHAIKTGNAYLKSQQKPEGYWMDKSIPAYTSLAITAAMRDPNLKPGTTPEHIKKAYTYLLSMQKPNGGIYGKILATYNTSLGIMALCASGDKAHVEPILKARAFLIGQQANFKDDDMKKFNGGIGYGGRYKHSDLSNTYFAIEALKLSEPYAKDGKHGKQPELDWDSALQFISRCQNLQKTNDQPNVGNDGSMFYFPGNSKAGFQTNPDGTKTLRGYGSMSYAGLLSMIYADLDQSDPRIVALKKWLSNNFSVKENPGIGQQGLYYYYHAMAKGLAAANIDYLITKDGKKIDWRRELANAILSTQAGDGHWVNKNSRWWESQPVLVTSFAVLTLEQIHASIPKPIKD